MPAPASRHPRPTRGKPTKAANPSRRLPRRRQASASIHPRSHCYAILKNLSASHFLRFTSPSNFPLLPGHSRIHPLHELPTHLRIRRASPYFLQKCGTLQRIAPQGYTRNPPTRQTCFCLSVTPSLSTNASYSAKSRLSCRSASPSVILSPRFHARRMSVAYRPHARRATVSRTRNPSNLFIASINELLAFIFPLFCLTLFPPPVRDARKKLICFSWF